MRLFSLTPALSHREREHTLKKAIVIAFLRLPCPHPNPLPQGEGANPKKYNHQGLPGGAALARAYR
ncbi:hypothetical protein NUKP62_04870 [Klebsiella variicola]|nr:hypothetical protein NUKP62_04870 [Klebsiella variicola]